MYIDVLYGVPRTYVFIFSKDKKEEEININRGR